MKYIFIEQKNVLCIQIYSPFFLSFYFFIVFKATPSAHEVPGIGVKLELHLQAMWQHAVTPDHERGQGLSTHPHKN